MKRVLRLFKGVSQLRQPRAETPQGQWETWLKHWRSCSCRCRRWRYTHGKCGCGLDTSRTDTSWTCLESCRTASFQRCLNQKSPVTHSLSYTTKNILLEKLHISITFTYFTAIFSENYCHLLDCCYWHIIIYLPLNLIFCFMHFFPFSIYVNKNK